MISRNFANKKKRKNRDMTVNIQFHGFPSSKISFSTRYQFDDFFPFFLKHFQFHDFFAFSGFTKSDGQEPFR